MKRYFHEELETVRTHLMLMGEKAVSSVSLAMKALLRNDMALAEQVIEADDEIDELEKQIEIEVARYVGLRAPVARDLRLLMVAVKASHDIERIGDEATSIATRAIQVLADGRPVPAYAQIPRMSELAVKMVQDVMQSFIQGDEALAYSIFKRDAEVDDLNRRNFEELVGLMKGDSDHAADYTELVFISKSFERIADHAKNIAEKVYYLLTGRSLKAVIREESGK